MKSHSKFKASLSMICLNLEMSQKENQQVNSTAKQNETGGSCDLKRRRGGCVPVCWLFLCDMPLVTPQADTTSLHSKKGVLPVSLAVA